MRKWPDSSCYSDSYPLNLLQCFQCVIRPCKLQPWLPHTQTVCLSCSHQLQICCFLYSGHAALPPVPIVPFLWYESAEAKDFIREVLCWETRIGSFIGSGVRKKTRYTNTHFSQPGVQWIMLSLVPRLQGLMVFHKRLIIFFPAFSEIASKFNFSSLSIRPRKAFRTGNQWVKASRND